MVKPHDVAADRSTLPSEQLLFSAPETATYLGIAESTLHKLNASGQVPRPRALGRRRLWSRDELRAWVDAGCPARSTWEAMRRETRT